MLIADHKAIHLLTPLFKTTDYSAPFFGKLGGRFS